MEEKIEHIETLYKTDLRTITDLRSKLSAEQNRSKELVLDFEQRKKNKKKLADCKLSDS